MESYLTGLNHTEDGYRPYWALQGDTADSYSNNYRAEDLQVLHYKAGLQQGGSKVVMMHKTIPSQVPECVFVI